MDKLKPCPFCGGTAHIERISYIRDYIIYCEECDSYFMLDELCAKEEDLIDAWNRRVKE